MIDYSFQSQENSSKAWAIASILSIFAHVSGLFLVSVKISEPVKTYEPVKVRVAEVEVPSPEPPPPIPPPPPPQPKPKPLKKTPAPNQTVTQPTNSDAAPIQGLTKDSVSDRGTFSAPVGNTLMIEDTGKRVKPDQVEALGGDLSEPAKLIRGSVKDPGYTTEAEDANIEGVWIVDVFVEVDGRVSSAELRKKIGFGMDQRVMEAAKAARFSPRKNKLGVSERGWAEIKFTLVLP